MRLIPHIGSAPSRYLEPEPYFVLQGYSRYSRYSRYSSGHLEPEPHFALEAGVDALLLGGAVALQQHA